MAFRQHHRSQPSRQLSFQPPEAPAEIVTASTQRKRPLEESQEWILFSPAAPSATARTHTTSTERTAGLSRLSDFGSLDTAARSDQDDDDITCQGTEEGEELDSLDDGLHAFHEPSEYSAPAGRLQQSGETVLPTHDGLGTFQPDNNVQEQLWQFERQPTRRRHVRRRSSVQRRLDALEEADELNQEQGRRERIEKWRMEQSKAILEEIERETRRRRRLSMASAARSRADSAHTGSQHSAPAPVAQSVSDGQSVSSDEGTENLSFWQRLTRRVIRDLMGIDEDTLSVIFGEALPEEAIAGPQDEDHQASLSAPSNGTSQTLAVTSIGGDTWEHRLLERIARELGILVHQLSEHPGAFSTYLRTQEAPEYVGLISAETAASVGSSLTGPRLPSSSPTTTQFAPTFPVQASSNLYSEASLWGIEEEPEIDPLDAFRTPIGPVGNAAEDATREQEYWERELDVKMVFNFLLRRFSSRRSSVSPHGERSMRTPPDQARDISRVGENNDAQSARRAAIIRQHHPLVNRNTDRLPTSSSNFRDTRRRDVLFRQHLSNQKTSLRSQVLKSNSSCASQSTKKSKRSAGSGRNYWDMGGSIGSGGVLAGEV